MVNQVMAMILRIHELTATAKAKMPVARAGGGSLYDIPAVRLRFQLVRTLQ